MINYSLTAIFNNLKRASKTFASAFPDIVIIVLSTMCHLAKPDKNNNMQKSKKPVQKSNNIMHNKL